MKKVSDFENSSSTLKTALRLRSQNDSRWYSFSGTQSSQSGHPDIEVKVKPGVLSVNTDSKEVVAEVKTEPKSDDGPDNLYPTDIELNLEPESPSANTHCNTDADVTVEPGDSSINNDSDEGVAKVRTEPRSDVGAGNLSPTELRRAAEEPAEQQSTGESAIKGPAMLYETGRWVPLQELQLEDILIADHRQMAEEDTDMTEEPTEETFDRGEERKLDQGDEGTREKRKRPNAENHEKQVDKAKQWKGAEKEMEQQRKQEDQNVC
ncbi:uncharacterized protein [Watersipora subatra]|uniref:uncharacterized protein n=1 Tax=Watersipora subatra TaxID=2589382 RepID=UPI00355AD088